MAIDPTTALIFKSKTPHNTLFLEVEYPVGNPPQELFAALEAINWKPENWIAPQSFEGRQTTTISRRGGGLFTSWTTEEQRQFMPEVRSVLRRFNFTRVPHHRLTLADML